MTKEEALNPKPHEKIAHLSKDEIDTVMEQYYSGENIKEIIENFNIEVSPSKLSSLFPPKVITDAECPYCKFPFWEVRPSKSSNSKPKAFCPKCNHYASNPCSCNNCQIALKTIVIFKREKKREKINQILKANIFDYVDYGNLNLIQKTYLGALLFARLSEDRFTINPFSFLGRPVSPTGTLDKEIYEELMNNRIIRISPQTCLDDLELIKDDTNIDFDWFKVSFSLNVKPSDGDQLKMIDSLINPAQQNGNNSEEVCALWKKIALNECIEYLLIKMNDSGFDFNPGEKTYSVFENLLTYFSTSQIYKVIWSSIKSSVNFLKKENISKNRAANSVITNCDNYGKKAIEEKWHVPAFDREKKIPQTALSKHFYDKILGIGDKGFHQVPRILHSD
jgi:hypothetical protein